MTATPDVMFRARNKSDDPLIFSSWLESFRQNGLFGRGIGNTIFFRDQHKVIEALLARGTCVVICDASNPRVVVGWALAEMMDQALVLHYAYVKKRYRSRGFFEAMLGLLQRELKPAHIICSHLTRAGAEILRRRGWTYNPYVLLVPQSAADLLPPKPREPEKSDGGEQEAAETAPAAA